MAAKKVLFVTPTVIAQHTSGGMQVTQERLDALAKISDVTVLALEVDDQARKAYPSIDWITAGNLRARSTQNLFLSYTAGLPLSVWRNSHKEFVSAAKKLSEEHYDLAYVDHWLVAEAGLNCHADRRVLHLHNAEPEIFFRAALHARQPTRTVLELEGHRCVRYLSRITPKFDELHLLSGDDLSNLATRGISNEHTSIFYPAAPKPPSAIAAFATRNDSILFVGTLSWHANHEGLRWYAEHIHPHLPADIDMDVIGGGAPQSLSSMLIEHRNIIAHGYVDDIEPFYASAKCLVAPLLSGSGIKIKILHALTRGLPVVTTTTGIEGFPAGYGSAVQVSDKPEEMASFIQRLTIDRTAWEQASSAALDYAHKHFSGADWHNWTTHILSDKVNQCLPSHS
ncbi:glycosyltransferase [Aquabacterium sp.]|uniref:glycosyltransferase n=1 Tax=Aquabacterium sp. TaxID=1872578 RepID=UPI0035AE2D75